MTVPLEMIFGVLSGLVLAACAREQFSVGETPWSRGLAAMLSFGVLIFLPVSEYYYLVFPDWAWMYLVDPKRLPLGIGLLVVLAFSACMLGGYLSGWALVRARKPRFLWLALGMVAFAFVLFGFFSRGRLLSDGSFASYQAGKALSLSEGKLGWALGITSAGVLGALGWLGQWLVRRGRSFGSSADGVETRDVTPGPASNPSNGSGKQPAPTPVKPTVKPVAPAAPAPAAAPAVSAPSGSAPSTTAKDPAAVPAAVSTAVPAPVPAAVKGTGTPTRG